MRARTRDRKGRRRGELRFGRLGKQREDEMGGYADSTILPKLGLDIGKSAADLKWCYVDFEGLGKG